jgi:hypothetical protein
MFGVSYGSGWASGIVGQCGLFGLNKGLEMSDKLEMIKEQIGDALASWEESNGGKITNGWLHAANPVAIIELLAELEEKDRRIAELERIDRAADKVEGE